MSSLKMVLDAFYSYKKNPDINTLYNLYNALYVDQNGDVKKMHKVLIEAKKELCNRYRMQPHISRASSHIKARKGLLWLLKLTELNKL